MSCNAMPGGRRRKGGNAPETEAECAAAGGNWRDGKCEPVPAPFGGRRRSRKGKKTMKGGMGYGFGGAMGTNGPLWGASWGGEVTKGGEPVYDTLDPQRGSGRRRKSKKASKKSKKGGKRRRTMRGGAQWQSVAPAGGGFTGEGKAGLASWTGYDAKVPPSAGGPLQNLDGAYSP